MASVLDLASLAPLPMDMLSQGKDVQMMQDAAGTQYLARYGKTQVRRRWSPPRHTRCTMKKRRSVRAARPVGPGLRGGDEAAVRGVEQLRAAQRPAVGSGLALGHPHPRLLTGAAP